MTNRRMALAALGVASMPVLCRAAVPALGVAAAGDSLDRPAVAVRSPGAAVLLGATLAGGRIVAVGERGIVALSDDAGRSWRQAAVPTSVTLTAVRFADAKRGWAVGHAGSVLATEDGGERWQRVLDGRQAAQRVLQAARSAGDATAVQQAERLVADGPDKPLLDLLLMSGGRLLAVGAYGLALASDDDGRSWQSWEARLPNPKGLHLYAARQRGDHLLLAGEQGLVLLSDDGGRSFSRAEVPYKGSFFSAEMPGEHGLLLAGLRGNVLRSADDGATWSAVPTPMPASIIATALGPQGQLLAVNQAGFVMALQADRLVPLHSRPLPPLNGVLPMSDGAPLALTVRGPMPVPTDSGKTP